MICTQEVYHTVLELSQGNGSPLGSSPRSVQSVLSAPIPEAISTDDQSSLARVSFLPQNAERYGSCLRRLLLNPAINKVRFCPRWWSELNYGKWGLMFLYCIIVPYLETCSVFRLGIAFLSAKAWPFNARITQQRTVAMHMTPQGWQEFQYFLCRVCSSLFGNLPSVAFSSLQCNCSDPSRVSCCLRCISE